MTIARWTNIEVNHVDMREAEGYSGNDYQSMTGFLAQLPLNPQQLRWFVQQGEGEAQRIIALAQFREALDAVASFLIQSLQISDYEMAKVVEHTVGNQLRSAARDPFHHEISLAAYYLHLGRVGNAQAADSVDDWIVAERGVRFGIASIA